MCQMGPQLKMKRARLVGNECLTVSQQKPTSCAPDLGKVLVMGCYTAPRITKILYVR